MGGVGRGRARHLMSFLFWEFFPCGEVGGKGNSRGLSSSELSQHFISGTGLSFQARLLLAQIQRNWPEMNHFWKCSITQRVTQRARGAKPR